MNTMIKMLTLLVVINVFMYIGVNFSISAEGGRELNKVYNFHFKGDLIDSFMSGSNNLDTLTNNTKENWTSYDIEFDNATFTQRPDQQGGVSVGTGGIIILDSLAVVWKYIATLANIMIAPLTLFFNFRMPIFVGLIIGIPYFFVLVLTFIAFLRGVGD